MGMTISKETLALCVLSLLCRRDMYGYEIISAIAPDIALSEGSVYPMLKRFREDGWVTVYLTESQEGPPRKYYAITEKGRQACNCLRKEWQRQTERIIQIMG